MTYDRYECPPGDDVFISLPDGSQIQIDLRTEGEVCVSHWDSDQDIVKSFVSQLEEPAAADEFKDFSASWLGL